MPGEIVAAKAVTPTDLKDCQAAPSTSSPVEAAPKTSITCLRFNQDGSSLIVVTRDGFRVFDLSVGGEIVMAFDFDTIPQVIHIQRLYNSNLAAFVSALDPEAIKIFNLKRNEVICEYRYGHAVEWLAVNRVRVVVAADQKVIIHKVRNMEVIHTIRDITTNPAHLYAMATYELRSYLAFPCDLATGIAAIYDLDSCKERHRVRAHRSPLAALCMNEQVTRLATSSSKGTVVRVFDTASGYKLHELRRGLWSVAVHCLAFSSNGEYMGCTSDHETVHVFKIPTNEQRAKLYGEQSWLASVGHLASQATGLVCAEAERYMQEERSFITLPNPYHGIKTELTLKPSAERDDKLRLQICGFNGFLSGFLLEKTDKDWTSQLQHAYYLTETVTPNPEKSTERKKPTASRRRGSTKRWNN